MKGVVQRCIALISALIAHERSIPEMKANREQIHEQIGLKVNVSQIVQIAPQIFIGDFLPRLFSNFAQFVICIVELRLRNAQWRLRIVE